MWVSVGGAEALASYGKAPGVPGTLADVPAEHWEFIEEVCVNWHETDTHIFVHANLFPSLPLDEQPELMLFWEFLKWPIGHVSGKTVICGHSSQRSGRPLDLGDTVCIDTAIHAGGWLTGLDVHDRRYWQADAAGRTRDGWLEDL
jgi:serine/threonine protein phosphatase 1